MREADPPISLALVATIHQRFSDHPDDDLAGADSATAWLRRHGFPSVAHLTDAEASDLRALREAIFTILTARTTGTAQDPRSIGRLNDALHRAHDPISVRIDDDSPDRLVVIPGEDPGTTDSVLHRIAADAASVTTGAPASRLRQCAAHTCGTFFLDTSRAGNRKWCSSASCGNRVRVAAHRDRV